MKKKILIGALVLTLGVSAIGCSNEDLKEKPNTNIEENNEKDQGITTNDVDFEVINEPSEEIKESLNYIKDLRGFGIIMEEDNNYIIFIGSGEKPTGGYNIEVVSVEDIEGKTKITVKETSPKEGDMVTTALTYPYTLIKIDKESTNIEVVNTEGDILKDFNDERGENDI